MIYYFYCKGFFSLIFQFIIDLLSAIIEVTYLYDYCISFFVYNGIAIEKRATNYSLRC